ncbi:MAG TPA: hypothetical protein VKU79_04275 [Thermoplasmataceae archaeon]|nr:hypothetical protein [Thermoplasmatales archaeon AK]HLH86061.1 hypothetical protein [Thermoplasmataceae archaeon]
MTGPGFMECFKHLEDNEESAAECIHCLKKHGEQIFYDDYVSRLRMGREIYDSTVIDQMIRITNLLGIKSRQDYEEMDKKYNLTMY